MSRLKIFALIALFTFASGLAIVGDAMAGEKIKVRNAHYMLKWETVNVPGEEGWVLIHFEEKGISTVLQGRKILDGLATVCTGSGEMNTKAGTGSIRGPYVLADRDGDRFYLEWEGKLAKGVWSGTVFNFSGTGKFEGVKGKGVWTGV
jgi:hypothetical protein